MSAKKEAPAATEAANDTALRAYYSSEGDPAEIMLCSCESEIERFCKALFSNINQPGFVQLRAFMEHGTQPALRPWEAVKLDPDAPNPLQSLIKKAAMVATSAGLSKEPVLFCPPVVLLGSRTSAKEGDIQSGIALSWDLDLNNPEESQQELARILRLPPTVSVASGGTCVNSETGEVVYKRHIHYRLTEPTETLEEHAQLKRARKLGNFIIGGDTTNTPLVHPIRWPGSWHRKGEPKLAQIAAYNIDSEITLPDALERLEEAAAARGYSEEQHSSGAKKRARKSASEYLDLADGIRSGESYHDPIVRISAQRVANGMNERSVIDELQALMNASEGPRDERWQSRYTDIPRIVRGALKFKPDHESEADISGLIEHLEKTAPSLGWEVVPYGVDIEPDLSHDALALDLSKAGFSKDARYIHTWGAWLFWDDTRWIKDDRLLHFTAARDFLRAKAQKLKEWGEKKKAECQNEKEVQKLEKWVAENCKALRQASCIAAVESVARSNADLVASADQFDADVMRLGTPGGTVDLKTGKLLPAHRGHWITKQAAITPAERGTSAPLWSGFLWRIFDGDQETIDFLQRAAGYALTGQTSEHKLLFLYGTGRNGKSVFLNTLFDIMGDYSKRAAAQTFLDSHGERHPTDLAGLHGARLVAGSELPPGKVWNESVIKDLTGGDVITARFMRQDFFDFLPQFTLFIAGNHQPSFRGIDEAIRARVVLVPFMQTIPAEERDPMLPDKLRAEWPAILRWMIDGAVEWQSRGLDVPGKVKSASAEYLDSEDAIAEFIEDNLIYGMSNTATADMYQRFQGWQRAGGLTTPWTKTAMTKALKERGLDAVKLSGGVRGFRGVGLNANAYKSADDYMTAKYGTG